MATPMTRKRSTMSPLATMSSGRRRLAYGTARTSTLTPRFRTSTTPRFTSPAYNIDVDVDSSVVAVDETLQDNHAGFFGHFFTDTNVDIMARFVDDNSPESQFMADPPIEAGAMEAFDIGAFTRRMFNNPARSGIASLGLGRIQEAKDRLTPFIWRWGNDSKEYEGVVKAKIQQLEGTRPYVDEKYDELQRVSKDYHLAIRAQQEVENALHEAKQSHRFNLQLWRIGKLLETILEATFAGEYDDEKFAVPVDISIEEIRNRVKLHSWDDIKVLSRDVCLGILAMLEVIGYGETNYFKGLWRLPPDGINRVAWTDTYGISPAILTGKGTFTANSIRRRLGHYLGFAVPLETESPTQVELSGMSNEDLDKIQHDIEIVKSQRAGTPIQDAGMPEAHAQAGMPVLSNNAGEEQDDSY